MSSFCTRLVPALVAVIAVAVVERGVAAEVTVYDDQGEWESALGSFNTVDFTGYPDGTPITDQYADLGVNFTDGLDFIFLNPGFENDGAGLDGVFDIDIAFDSSTYGIAASFPGYLRFELFSQGESIYTSTGFGGGGTGFFFGLISYHPFDHVVLSDPVDGAVFIDDLQFGPLHVPGPPALALFAIAARFGSRRRRRYA